MISDIFIWWLTAQGFGLIGLLPARFLFRALPDRGYAFAKTLGLLLTGYLAWLLAMLGLAPFGRALVVVCALLVGAAGFFIAREPRTVNQESQGRFLVLGSRFFAEWRLILAYELIFALALVFLALQRSIDYQFIINPNPWGTERPMDYALFNAIRQSASFPPHDPWLAGYSVNYYYLGYLLMAVVSLASGIAWGAAYNLSLALIFALTALGVAGVVWNLIGLTAGDGRRATDDRRPKDLVISGRRSFVFGRMVVALLAIVLVLFAGNLGGALQVVSGTPMILALKGGDMARALANGLGARAPLPLVPPFKGWDFDGTSVITPTDRVAQFDWWPPSRAVWDSFPNPSDPAAQPERRYTITEFPFFSFWLGDMHPHVMALPFGLLALALALQTVARPAAPTFAMGRRGWAELALVGIVLGSLYLLNSWDLPTYVLLFLGALLLLYIRLGRPDAGESSVPRSRSLLHGVWWRHYATQAALALIAAFMLFVPFHLTFRSLVGGQAPLVDLPILATITRTIGFVTWSKTPLQNFLIIFGLFLLPLLAYVFAQGRSGERANGRASEGSVAIAHSPVHPLTLSVSLPWIILGALVVGVLAGFPLLALLPLAVYAASLAIERAEQPAAAFALWAFALVCLVCFGTEIVYIRDSFGSRMNTIFKFYYQAWLIWGVLAGYALWFLFRGRSTMDDGRWKIAPGKSFIVYRLSSIVFAGLFCAWLAGALVYPSLTAGKAFREGQRVGLNGTTPRERTPDGAAGIAWLRDNASSGAVVLEAVGQSYDTGGQGFGQVAGATGLATVLGWPGHEQQWRGGDPAALAQLGPREADVTAIYSSTDTQQANELLRKYNVDYIYVGAAERSSYPAEGVAKLAQLGDVVFQQGEVTIYRVKR